VLSGKKAEHFKQVLETELNRVLATAEQETRASAARHADPADQAGAEYERQSIVHKSNTSRQMLKTLTQAVERIQQGNFGECAECGGDIEPKRLQAIPWARYCVRCQEARSRADVSRFRLPMRCLHYPIGSDFLKASHDNAPTHTNTTPTAARRSRA
jgi:DnaK suppressor protein